MDKGNKDAYSAHRLSGYVEEAMDAITDMPPKIRDVMQLQLPKVLQDRLRRLTPSERRVLAGLLRGMLSKQIAWELNRTEMAVKIHRSSIRKKMGVANTQALIVSVLQPLIPSVLLGLLHETLAEARKGKAIQRLE